MIKESGYLRTASESVGAGERPPLSLQCEEDAVVMADRSLLCSLCTQETSLSEQAGVVVVVWKKKNGGI